VILYGMQVAGTAKLIANCYTNYSVYFSLLVQGGPKTGLFLRADNFATVGGMKACDMSKVSKFCQRK